MSNTPLPSGWSLPTLALVADVSSGIGFPNEFQGNSTGDLPFYKVSDVSIAVKETGGILCRANHYVSHAMAVRLKGRPLRVGTTVFAKIGEAVHLNRRAFVSTPCLIDNNVMAVKSRFDSMDRYLHYFLKTVELGEYARSTTVPSLRKGDVESLLLPLAPEAEQTRIANQLDTLLARVQACNDRFNAIPALLKRFRQTVLDVASSGALTEDWRAPNELRQGEWKTVALQDVITEMRNGLAQKPTESPPGSKILRIGAVRSGQLNLDDHRYLVVSDKEAEQYALKKDDILFTRYNGSLEFVGVCAALTHDAPGYVYPDKLIRVRVRADRAHAKFIEIVFGCRTMRTQVESFVKSSAGQRGVSGADLKAAKFSLPPIAEQAEIVRRVVALFALADRIEARCTAARTQAQRLTPLVLAKAFRGELVPQDPNDEPASALLARIASSNTAVVGKIKRKVPAALKKRAQAAIYL